MSESKTHSASPAASDPSGHEGSDPKIAPVIRFALILTVLCVITLLGIHRMFFLEVDQARAEDPPLSPLVSERQVPPEPRLQSMPGVPLPGLRVIGETLPEGVHPFMSSSSADFEKKQNEALTSYGWIDRQAGIVHIPIDRAIELTLKKGLPTAQTKR